ncbi:MAG: gamma-glutamylcyclotransferase family protein [Pseudoxanthomonas sp.]
MSTHLYFAYGSNLLRERLLARCPGAIFIGRACLPGHRLTFDKVSRDGSGKCAFVPAQNSRVEGVLWEIPDVELPKLDRMEGAGHGYERDTVTVTLVDGGQCDALTYRATECEPGLKPYDWYLALVKAGAEQQGLPDEVRVMLAGMQALLDPLPERPARQEALEVLRKAGFEEVARGLE